MNIIKIFYFDMSHLTLVNTIANLKWTLNNNTYLLLIVIIGTGQVYNLLQKVNIFSPILPLLYFLQVLPVLLSIFKKSKIVLEK